MPLAALGVKGSGFRGLDVKGLGASRFWLEGKVSGYYVASPQAPSR